MKKLGLEGVRRAGTKCLPDEVQDKPLDLVNLQFAATCPNQLWVVDITFVATWSGFVYVAFVINVFSRCIVGWKVGCLLRTELVLDALEQVIWARKDTQNLIHHIDRGSQYLSIVSGERTSLIL